MIYGLLGPNGAGKTSLVRAISGRLRLDDGTVLVCGGDPARDPRARRQLGLVPQDIALYADLTARENLEIFGRLMGLSAADTREAARVLLATIELEERADDRVATLSGGMRRRLNVAAGVIHRPRLLLLDEPTVGVDPAAREAIHDLLLQLRRDGMAILMTTHDLDQVADLADRVGVLIDGRLHAEGTVRDLIREQFGDGRELILRLRQPPSGDSLTALETRGFSPSEDQRIWSARVDSSMTGLQTVSAGLEAAGLAIEEIRIREPGLRGVFFRLAGREIDA